MITKEEAKERIKELVEKFLKYTKEELDSMPEEDIKFQFIEPLFEVLGWKREEISKEKRILRGRADYILRIGNQDKLVVEAKKTNVRLSEEEGRQAVSYAHHKKIKFAVLTNFKHIRVYHALSNIKDIDRNLLKKDNAYFRIEVNELLEKFDLLWLLSRESFENEEIDELLKNIDKKLIKPIDETILTDLLQFREWLSKDLKSKRMHLTKEQIEEVVQSLIDRLIFMRSVEDRGLEAKDFLLKIVNDVEKGFTEMNLWAILKTQFKRFDTTYNSKLFVEGLLEKEGFFEKNTLIKVIKGLYYGTQTHQERYMFDEISVDLLGSIYEQYLGVVLRGTEKRVKLDLISGKRKKMGIYYTPSYIVDYIVKNTIGKYIKNKSIDEILEVRIVDPACGSGSFLIRAFQEICDKIEELMKEDSKTTNATFKKYNSRLNLAQKITILTRCIYGVDLDEKAVELAQLNLLLKLLEEETRDTKKKLLPNMQGNIKCGNSLIDDMNVIKDKAFRWKAQFPDVFKEGGFDIVIGNPPYFNLQTIKDKKIKDSLKSSFNQIHSGQNDILYYFYALGIKVLKKQGVLGFITSRYFLEADHAKKLRNFLSNNSELLHILDFGSKPRIFGEASINTAILIYKKVLNPSASNKLNIVKVGDIEDGEIIINCILENKDCPGLFKFQNEQKDFKSNKWVLYSKGIGSLIEKMNKNSGVLGDIQSKKGVCKIFKSIESGLDRSKTINKGQGVYRLDKKTIKKYKIEKEVLKPLIKNGMIRRYLLNWTEEFLLFIDNEVDINKYPNSLAYLSRFKKELTQRYDYIKGNFPWYRLSNLRNIKLIKSKQDKLFVPMVAPENRFIYVNQNKFICTADVYVLILQDLDFNLKYIQGILNSKLMNYFVKQNSKAVDGSAKTSFGGSKRRFSYSIGNISSIPIKKPSKQQEQRIIELVNQMLELQEKYHDEKISGGEKERLEQQIKNIDYEIDQEVYKLYNITSEEQKIIEESLK